MVLLKVISDLHLNRPNNTPISILNHQNIPPIKDETQQTVLAILGDIGGHYEELFKYTSTLGYDYTLFVPGNHEYYNTTIQIQHTKLKALCDRHNVTLLDRSTVTVGDTTFIGATLWTNVPLRLRTTAFDHLKEVKLIKYGLSRLTVDQYVKLHERDVKWISQTLTNLKDQGTTKIVVLTHHAPSFKLCRYCSQGDRSNDANIYFASNLDDLARRATLWCCGHIHESTLVNNMLINAYPARNYDPNLVINLDDVHNSLE